MVLIPSLQKQPSILIHHTLDHCEFVGREFRGCGQSNRFEPEFCQLLIPLYVNMRRLAEFVTVEEKSIWANAVNGW
jgi:hypothetical protein